MDLSYGRAFGDKLSLGATGKWVNAELANVSANAFAVDLGSFYKWRDNLQLAATLMNMGNQLTFLSDGDPLPMAFHAGAVYEPMPVLKLALESVFPRTGRSTGGIGGEWVPLPTMALRVGYRTDALKGLSPIAGFSTGIGISLWGQELSYAWVPYGDLGDSQYISLVMRFGEVNDQKRNLIQYEPVKKQRTAEAPGEQQPEYDQLMNLLNDEPKPTPPPGNPPPH